MTPYRRLWRPMSCHHANRFDGALGLISPARLRQATVTTQGRRNYVTGKATLTNLPDPGSS
jgi:hypothetical protein